MRERLHGRLAWARGRDDVSGRVRVCVRQEGGLVVLGLLDVSGRGRVAFVRRWRGGWEGSQIKLGVVGRLVLVLLIARFGRGARLVRRRGREHVRLIAQRGHERDGGGGGAGRESR